MNRYPTDDPFEDFETQIRSLTPRPPQRPFESEVFTNSPTDSGIRVDRAGLVRWMAGSCVCGAALGAAVMYFLLSFSGVSKVEPTRPNSNSLAAVDMDASEKSPTSSPSQSLVSTSGQQPTDWIERIQSLPAGSLGVGSSLMISLSQVTPMRAKPRSVQSEFSVDSEIEFSRPTLKNQRELMREMLRSPREFY